MDRSADLRKLNSDARCPFYVGSRPSVQKQACGIQCEALMDEDKLGFNVWNYQTFRKFSEMQAYHAIFCADMYETCPYFKAMMEIKYKEWQ